MELLRSTRWRHDFQQEAEASRLRKQVETKYDETSNTVPTKNRAGNLLKTNRGVRKLNRQYKVRSMPKKRLPAIATSAAREKVPKGRARTRWGNAVNKVREDIGGHQEDIMSRSLEVHDRTNRNDRKKGKACVKREGRRGRRFRHTREM